VPCGLRLRSVIPGAIARDQGGQLRAPTDPQFRVYADRLLADGVNRRAEERGHLLVALGRIVAQTVHDTLQSAPGSTCPAAP